MNPHDPTNQTDALIRQYRQISDSEQPSPDLDDAIVSYARASTRRPERWIWPVSVAAALLLTVGLFARMSQLPTPDERSQWHAEPSASEVEGTRSERPEQVLDADVKLRPETPAIGNSQSMNQASTDNSTSEPAIRLNHRDESPSADQPLPASAAVPVSELKRSGERSDQAAAYDLSAQKMLQEHEQDSESAEFFADDAPPEETRLRAAASMALTDQTSSPDWLIAVQAACKAGDASTLITLLERHDTRQADDALSTEVRACLERLEIDPESIGKRVPGEQDIPQH